MNTGKPAVLALTANGKRLAERVADGLGGADLFGREGFEQLPELWKGRESLIFIMATGIVVRKIAPLLGDKMSDPAVVVVDEAGTYAISLISGHVGGANELAERIAEITGGAAVITTASDVNGIPAVDMMAKELDFAIENRRQLKSVARKFIDERKVAIFTDIPLGRWEALFGEAGGVVRPLDAYAGERNAVLVTDRIVDAGNALLLRPRRLWLGIGCRRGVSKGDVLEAIEAAVAGAGLSPLAVIGIASIDVKKNEVGLVEAAEELGLPIRFYSATELAIAIDAAKNNGLEIGASEFVRKTVGVESVCEAASLLASNLGRLVLPKTIYGPVTMAIARAEES